MRDCRGNYSSGNSLGNPRNAVAHNLAASISDVGWGTFINFLAYKLERKGGKLVEIDRWFPSSKLCSDCFYQMGEMSLEVRDWTCPNCGTHHDRDGNAAQNIRAEGIRMRACGRFSRLCCRRGGKTKNGTKVSFEALAYEYRSSAFRSDVCGGIIPPQNRAKPRLGSSPSYLDPFRKSSTFRAVRVRQFPQIGWGM
jgi:putative transposase